MAAPKLPDDLRPEIPPARWRWAYGEWCADRPAAGIATALGISVDQVYHRAHAYGWPRRTNRANRLKPRTWRCQCGHLNQAARPQNQCGHLSPWAAIDARLAREMKALRIAAQ